MKNVQTFLRFTNFYQQFIKNYEEIAELMNKLIRKNVLFI